MDFYSHQKSQKAPQIKLSPRHQLQWSRKLLHLFNGTCGIWLYLYSGLSREWVLLILAVTVFLNLSLDLTRIFSRDFNTWFVKRFHRFMRVTEDARLTSATKGLGTTLIVLLIFPERVGILIMLFVTYSDTFGGIIGSLVPSPKINSHASVAGSLAVFICSYLLTFFSFYFIVGVMAPLSFWQIQTLSLASAGIAFICEGLFPQWDDNLLLPLLGAPLLWMLFKIMGL